MREVLAQRALADLVDLVNDKIVVGKDPDARYVGLENLVSGSPDLAGWSPAATSISTNGVFREGDTLFGKLRPNLRKCVLAPFDGYCSTDLLVLRAREGFAPRFASRVLQSGAVFHAAVLTAVGTKMPRTSWHALRNRTVFAPPLPEQRQIAAVLDTLDDAIRKTEQIIAKLKQVKQGLLHDLLTRGIDDNGELRDPERHPEQFKESALGRIPKAWEVGAAREVCTLITKGTTPPPSAFRTDERSVRYLRVDNLTFTGQLDLSLSPLFIDRRTHELALARSRVREGDVLMNIVGPPLGKVSVVPRAQHDWNINQAIAIFRPAEPRVTPSFLATWLLSGAQTWLRGEAKQTSGQVNLTLEMCGTLPLPLPDSNEQLRIIQRLDVLGARLSAESSALSKLRVVKSGLMEDLLTGRVRVTPLLENASP